MIGLRGLARRSWRWWLDPFVVKVDVHESTLVEHRAFPYRLRVQAVESLQAKVDRGGVVTLPKATVHLTSTLNVTRSGTHLVGLHLQGHGPALTAIHVDVPEAADIQLAADDERCHRCHELTRAGVCCAEHGVTCSACRGVDAVIAEHRATS